MNIVEFKAALQIGSYARRSIKSNRNGDGWLFLKVIGGQEFLFAVHLNQETGEGIESPASLDWNDLVATDWSLYLSGSETTGDSRTNAGSFMS